MAVVCRSRIGQFDTREDQVHVGGAPSGATTIGLRPEHIQHGDGRACQVVRIEHLGDQTRLHLSLEGHKIVTLTDARTRLEPGESVAIQPRVALYFDASGARIT